MRIALVTRDYPPNVGGMAAHVYHLGRALRALGHEVVVVRPRSTQASEESGDTGGVAVLDALYPWHPARAVRVLTRTLRTVQVVRSWEGEAGRADIVHIHDYLTSAIAGAMLGRSRAYVWTNHSSRFLADAERPVRRIVLRLLYGAADGIITASPDRRERTASLWPTKRIVYIPNGVDVEAFHSGLATDRRRFGIDAESLVVLCPSRLAPNKGVRDFALMAETLVREREDIRWHFVLAGGDPSVARAGTYGAEVYDIFSRIGNSGRMTFMGAVPLDRMPTVHGLADVVVLPSIEEAVSLAALEAMASGRPVVATTTGGFPEIISPDRSGFLVAPGQPNELADIVLRLALDEELRRTMGMRASRHARAHYAWHEIASQTADFYRSVIGEG